MPLEKPTIPVSFPGSIRKSDLLKRCILRSGRRCCLPFLLLEEALPLHDKSGCGSNGGGESQYNEGYRPGVHPELEGEAVGAGVAELKGIPQLIIAGSSIDDIVRIVFYQCFLTREKGGDISYRTFLNIPISIVSGIGVGILLGLILSFTFAKSKREDAFKLLLVVSLCFGLTYLENILSPYFGYSSLLFIIACAIVIHKKQAEISISLKSKFNEIWSFAEIFLFVLVGAGIKIEYAGKYFLPAFILLLASLSFRSLAVSSCLVKTDLNRKEGMLSSVIFQKQLSRRLSEAGYSISENNC